MDGCGRLLAAVMEALCHPTVKLTSIMPINCEPEMQQLLNKQYAAGNHSKTHLGNCQEMIMILSNRQLKVNFLFPDDNTNSAAQSRDTSQFPLLVSHMTQRTEMEGVMVGHWTFREVLDRLLLIVVLPVRQMLLKVRIFLGYFIF